MAPPHTAASIKFRIAKAEGFDNREIQTALFLTPSSRIPMDDSGRVVIFGANGPGVLPREPVALVIRWSEPNSSPMNGLGDIGHEIPSAEPHYSKQLFRHYFDWCLSCLPVYYRLYTYEGEMETKHPIDREDISLARIDAKLISPPHKTGSIKRFISRYEGNPSLTYGNLFADIWSEYPLNDEYISILARDSPGHSPEEPIAIVHIDDRDNLASPLRGGGSPIPTPSQGERLPQNENTLVFVSLGDGAVTDQPPPQPERRTPTPNQNEYLPKNEDTLAFVLLREEEVVDLPPQQPARCTEGDFSATIKAWKPWRQ